VVGDCAKGLVAHALHGLGVPHSPDLFHAQHELTTALAPALAAKTRQAGGGHRCQPTPWLRTSDRSPKPGEATRAVGGRHDKLCGRVRGAAGSVA
jgi:hypothetical protein